MLRVGWHRNVPPVVDASYLGLRVIVIASSQYLVLSP